MKRQPETDFGTTSRSADSARADQGLKRRLEALGSQEWRPFCEYPLGAQVLHEGTLYLCTSGHTASQDKAPGQIEAPWAKLASDESIVAAIAKAEQSAKSDASTKDSKLESSLKTLINQAKREAKNELYPIGSIYTNYNNSTNPASLLGFGTWTALPANYFLAQAGSRQRLYSWKNTKSCVI